MWFTYVKNLDVGTPAGVRVSLCNPHERGSATVADPVSGREGGGTLTHALWV
jgi:hypothetical protein